MQSVPTRLLARLLLAFLLGLVACHLIYRSDAETSSDDSKVTGGENSMDLAEPAVSHAADAPLQPIPDPGPGSKGFEPWANNEPINGEVKCDGSICETAIIQRHKTTDGISCAKGGMNDGPTLAFPTVLPRPSRGHLIEVGVKFLSDSKP